MRSFHLTTKEYNDHLNRYIQALNVNGRGQEAKWAKYYIFQQYQKGLNRVYQGVDGYGVEGRSLTERVSPPTDLSFKNNLDFSPIITPTVYQWQENDVFVNFAARHLGGGVLDTGWVQEEFLTTCLDLLPFIGNFSKEYSNLHRDPAIFTTRAIFEPNLKFYGRKTGLIRQYHSIEQDPSQVLHPLQTTPISIYWLSMAAINLRGRMATSSDVQSMLSVAIKAFYLALKTFFENTTSKRVIHTGNWGAGAFGWDARASFVIQLFAFGLARNLFRIAHPTANIDLVSFHYHTYDKATYDLIQSINLDNIGDLTVRNFSHELMTKLI